MSIFKRVVIRLYGEPGTRGHRVSELLKLVGLEDGRRESYDWVGVEKSLGLTLPEDYKEIVEKVPAGYFQGAVGMIRPGDMGGDKKEYLGYYAHRMEDMRSWRKDEPQRSPCRFFRSRVVCCRGGCRRMPACSSG